jgi:hypothetical protein
MGSGIWALKQRQIKGGTRSMELYTLASAAAHIGCTPNRLKSWMEKGFIPDHRIHLGQVRARVIDEFTIAKMKDVVKGIDEEGLTLRAAFERYFNEEEG